MEMNLFNWLFKDKIVRYELNTNGTEKHYTKTVYYKWKWTSIKKDLLEHPQNLCGRCGYPRINNNDGSSYCPNCGGSSRPA